MAHSRASAVGAHESVSGADDSPSESGACGHRDCDVDLYDSSDVATQFEAQ
jgi:hypothetical protein